MATNTSNPRVPLQQFQFRHRLPVQIRFNDIDMLGHVNNAIYLQYLDLGKSHYFEDVVPEAVDWKHINIVVVNINCDYYAPTHITEPIAVHTTTVKVGEKSLKLEQRIVNTSTGEVKCLCYTVMAGFDLTTGLSAPIDRKWVKAISEYEGREL